MHRAYLSGASATAPTPPASPSIGYPTAGSPGVSPAAVPGPYFYHMIVEEVMAVIEASGITPSQSDLTQLLSAIRTVSPCVVGSVRNARIGIPTVSSSAAFSADEVVVETSLGGKAYKISSFNKTINLGTTGAGGMDTGAAPVSGFVALYAIYNPTTGASALLGVNATSAVAPNVYGGANIPAGYTASALVSVLPTNASSQFSVALQRDRRIAIPLFQVLTGGGNTTATAFSLAAVVPKNAIAWGGFMVSDRASNVVAVSSTATGLGQFQTQAGVGGAVGAPFPSVLIDPATPQTAYYSVNGVGTGYVSASSYEI